MIESQGEWIPVAVLRVFGDPVGQPRPRACMRGHRAGVYDPGTADAWREAIAIAAISHRPRPAGLPLEEPICIVATFYLPPPTAASKRLLALAKPAYCMAKPDLDNLEKVLLDALTDAGWWKDDSIVVDTAQCKCYATHQKRPGVEIEIFRAREEP